MENSLKRSTVVIILVMLLLGILFPFAALSQLSGDYTNVFNYVFNSLLAHILMHMALFGGLAWIVMSFTSRQPMWRMVLWCLGSVLLVGTLQEVIQMVSVDVYNVGASLFDLGIDLAGGAIPLLIKGLVSRFSVSRQG